MSLPVGAPAAKSNNLAKYVELAVEYLRTGVRFPSPPPKRKRPPYAAVCVFGAAGIEYLSGMDGGASGEFVERACARSMPANRAAHAGAAAPCKGDSPRGLFSFGKEDN